MSRFRAAWPSTVQQNSPTYGDNFSFNASVSFVALSTATPLGSVIFTADGNGLSTVPLSSAIASYSTTTLAAGTHAMTAVYGGDANYNGATSSAVAITVAKAPTTLDAHAEHDPSGAGDEVILDVVVSTPNPLLTISGTVTVSENDQTIAQQA